MTLLDATVCDAFGVDALLELIAKDELGLETLATRNSDSLDFHDIAVWKLRAALRRAYHAARNSALRQQQEGDKT